MNKEKRDIRVVFLIFAVIFGIIAYRKYPSVLSYILVTVDILLILLISFSPLLLRPAFRLWLKFAHILGNLNTQILLSIMFILIFIPVGIIMRLLGRDPMQRKTQKNDKESYWEPYEIAGVKDKNRYERQF